MKPVASSVICLFVALVFLDGCAQTIGNTRFPEAAANYAPKKEYALSSEVVWKGVNDALDANRISVATSSRDDGRITTDYVQGQSQMHALGLLGVISTRYKYTIRISEKSETSTAISVVATLESSGDKMSAWRDISSENTAIVSKLENALYEQIDKTLSR